MDGNTNRRQLSLATRRELMAAVAARYGTATRAEKEQILDEFAAVTGYHRKHAIRALRANPRSGGAVAASRVRTRLYPDEVVSALTVLWKLPIAFAGSV